MEGQASAFEGYGLMTEDGGQMSEDRGQMLEGRVLKSEFGSWNLDPPSFYWATPVSRPVPSFQHGSPLWDFDFRCTDPGECWIAVPLTMGRLALYRLPYDQPPKSLTHP